MDARLKGTLVAIGLAGVFAGGCRSAARAGGARPVTARSAVASEVIRIEILGAT